jgi:hypothetical protein
MLPDPRSGMSLPGSRDPWVYFSTDTEPQAVSVSIETVETSRPEAGRTVSPHGEARRLRRSQRALVVLEGFLSLCGTAGGAYLLARPLDAMPVRYLEGTWFSTWRWPGLALFIFVGICPALAAGAQVRRLSIAPVGHLCVGLGMIAWIALEAAWVVISPPLQIVMGLVGVTIFALAIADVRQSTRVDDESDLAQP